VLLTDDTRISSFTLVWTAGTSPHTLLTQLNLPKERNRLKANAAMGVEDFPGVWALGDCAVIPDEKGGYQPPTAQHASREGKVLAHNILDRIRGEDLVPFRFKTLGLLASIGRRTGVARILGVNFSGFLAWWLWRSRWMMSVLCAWTVCRGMDAPGALVNTADEIVRMPNNTEPAQYGTLA
jgi:NADH dehydrogenase